MNLVSALLVVESRLEVVVYSLILKPALEVTE